MAEEEVAKSDDYGIEEWEKIWKEYDHKKQRKVTEELKKYLLDLLPEGKGSIFLPLCGQTSDLRWLYDKGLTVVGLDGVDFAVKKIVYRNKDLKFKTDKLEEEGVIRYQSQDGRMTLYVSDVTAPYVRKLGPFDAVFDYGAYTAIKPADRQKYIDTIFATLKPKYRYILEFCHDVSADCEHHPCVISFLTLKKEVGAERSIKVLVTNDISDTWEAASFFNSFVLLTPKQ